MKELEVGRQCCIKGRLLIKGTFPTFRHDRHRQLLLSHLPQGTFDMYNGWGTEEPFLASVGLLSDGGVEADDGSHRYDSATILGDLLADDASDFCVGIFTVGCGLQLAFANDLRVDRCDVGDKPRGRKIGCLTLEDDAVGGPWAGPPGSGEPDQGYIGRGTGGSVGGSAAVVEAFSGSTCQGKMGRVCV